MVSRGEIEEFIRSSFRSVWSLEVLLLLKREPRPWPRAEIVAALRASELIVVQSLASLEAAGLVACGSEGDGEYRAASPRAAGLADAAEALYSRSPDAVRRLIVGAPSAGLTAFADAFRLRKD